MNVVLLASYFSDIEKNFEKFVMNCLTVAGAYVIAYFGSGLILGALDKYAFKKKLPDFVKKSISVLTGLVIAILVALYLFRSGGSGGEGDGGPGTGTGDSKHETKGDEPPQPAPKNQPTPKPVELPKGTGKRTPVTIELLSGSAGTGGRTYRIDGELKNLEELKAALIGRAATLPDGIELHFSTPGPDPVVIDRHVGIQQLRDWHKTQKGIYFAGIVESEK